MDLNINSSIFIGFLALNLILGLLSSRGVSTIRSYSIGDKKFNTATIAATVVATWVSGEFFFTIIAETYTKGLTFISIALLGDFLGLFLVGVLFAPRMTEFLGKLSIAEAMGDLYGKHARIITAISGFIAISGIIAIQLKIAGLLFEYALDIPGVYGILSAGTIITLYSSLGGIKSVTFTDVMQFATFGVIIPTISYFLFQGVEDNQAIFNTLTNVEALNYNFTFSFANPEIYYVLSLFLWGLIPSFNPAIFQRIAMARNSKQAGRAFLGASLICLSLAAILCWIGVLVLTVHPGLKENEILKVIISDHNWINGFKGFIFAGIMAMVMSTVDSYINSSSVLLVHDLGQTLSGNLVKNELFATRVCSLFIGVIAMIFAMREGSFLDLFIWASMFYMPVVTVPFIMSIFGFRSSGKSVLIGMVAGFTTSMLWELFFKPANVGGLIPGMLANLICLFASHYLLKQPGGWIKKEHSHQFGSTAVYKKKSSFSFELLDFCKRNTPNNEALISLLGLFIMVSTFSSATTISKEVRQYYAPLLDTIYIFTLSASTILISYPIWSQRKKQYGFIPLIWNAVIFFILICSSFFAVLISEFSEIQLMIFMVNIIVISSMIKWRSALFFITTGVMLTLVLYKNFLTEYQLDDIHSSSLEFKIAYLLLLIIGILIIFLKPKQEEQELATEKNDHLSNRLNFQERELQEALELKAEFLRNITHEYHAPMTGVLSTAETLHESYDKLPEEMRKKSIANILKSAAKLDCFDTNIRILASLSKGKLELKKEEFSLTALIFERVEKCQKLYDKNPESHKVNVNIQRNIQYNGDETHVSKAIDNLIINALQYCHKGNIEIELKQEGKLITFSISDEGMGIPKNELWTIFDTFKVGSRSRTSAGGRGIGLAVVQNIIELHGGKIRAESDGVRGAKFIIELPC
jgi:Na+/proline symporter/signal transduction histidine kinase